MERACVRCYEIYSCSLNFTVKRLDFVAKQGFQLSCMVFLVINDSK